MPRKMTQNDLDISLKDFNPIHWLWFFLYTRFGKRFPTTPKQRLDCKSSTTHSEAAIKISQWSFYRTSDRFSWSPVDSTLAPIYY